MATTLAQLSAVLSINNTKFKKGLSGAQASMKGFSKQVNSLGAGLAPFIGITAGLAGLRSVVRGASNIIMDFEQSMADVRAITRATDSEFKALSDNAKKLGGSTKFTASEVAQLSKEYGKLGFTTQEIIDASEATLNLAAATGSELATAAEVAGNTIRAFGFDATETGRITDIMARSFSMSALDMSRFSESMKYVAPIAKAAGVSIEETTAMLSILADAGISGSMAGTALKKLFSELSTDGGTLQENLAQLAEEGITLASAQDEVGERAKVALLVLDDQIDRIPELTKAYETAGGAAKEMADIQLETLRGQLTILKSSYEGLILTMADNDTAMNNTRNAVSELSKVLQFQTEVLSGEREGFRKFQSTLFDVMVPIRGLVKLNIKLFDRIKNGKDDLDEVNEGLGEMELRLAAVSDEEEEIEPVLKETYEEWKAQNDIIRANIKLKEDLIAADLALQHSLYDTLQTMKGSHEEFMASFSNMSITGDMLDLPEEIFSEPELEELLTRFNTATDASKDMSDVLAVAFSQIGSSFAESMGQVAAGTKALEDMFKEMSALIMSALGDILITIGLSTSPIGVPLVLAGLALKGIASFAGAGGFSANRPADIQGQMSGSSSSAYTGSSTIYGNDIRMANTHGVNIANRVG
jgi:hypothetical protein